MNVEMIGVEFQQLDVENLINIPIELPSCSGTLKLGNFGNKIAQPLEQRALNKLSRKKWKKAKGKKNVVP